MIDPTENPLESYLPEEDNPIPVPEPEYQRKAGKRGKGKNNKPKPVKIPKPPKPPKPVKVKKDNITKAIRWNLNSDEKLLRLSQEEVRQAAQESYEFLDSELKSFSDTISEELGTAPKAPDTGIRISKYGKVLKPKVLFAGGLKSYERKINKFVDNKMNFKVISYGETRKVIFRGLSFNYFGAKSTKADGSNGKVKINKKLKAGFLVGMVLRDINAYIERAEREGLPIPAKIEGQKPMLVYSNPNNIRYYGLHRTVKAIDVNHCFWSATFKKGYITERTYLIGLRDEKEYKDSRLVAIGVLNKLQTMTEFKKGIPQKPIANMEYYDKYSPFYWSIISEVNELFYQVRKCLGGDLFMWLTDCAFINPDGREEVIKIIEDMGYSWKEYDVAFEDVTDRQIRWWSPEGKPKSISYNNRPSIVKPAVKLFRKTK